MKLITFRTLTVEDISELYQFYSDKSVMKYQSIRVVMESLDDALIFVNEQYLMEESKLTIRKGVELTKTKELIGSVMYWYYENKPSICEN